MTPAHVSPRCSMISSRSEYVSLLTDPPWWAWVVLAIGTFYLFFFVLGLVTAAIHFAMASFFRRLRSREPAALLTLLGTILFLLVDYPIGSRIGVIVLVVLSFGAYVFGVFWFAEENFQNRESDAYRRLTKRQHLNHLKLQRGLRRINNQSIFGNVIRASLTTHRRPEQP